MSKKVRADGFVYHVQPQITVPEGFPMPESIYYYRNGLYYKRTRYLRGKKWNECTEKRVSAATFELGLRHGVPMFPKEID